MTSVLTRDAELQTAEQSVPVRRGTMGDPGTTGPAAARRGSSVGVGRLVVVAGPPVDVVDQWGMQSFPASDPPANW